MEVLGHRKNESLAAMGDEDLKVVETSDLFLSYIKALEMNSQWVPKTNGTLKSFQMEIQGRIVVKGMTTLNLPYETVCRFFADPAYSRHITNILDTYKVLYEDDSWDRKLKVVQMVMKFAGPISDRQFLLTHTIMHQSENKVYMGSRSCLNYPFEQRKGTVMAMVYSSGFILERLTEDKTRMTMISDYDSRGKIPEFIKRWVAGKSVSFLRNIEEKIKKVNKEEQERK